MFYYAVVCLPHIAKFFLCCNMFFLEFGVFFHVVIVLLENTYVLFTKFFLRFNCVLQHIVHIHTVCTYPRYFIMKCIDITVLV